MSQEQKRIINDQQEALKKAHRAVAELQVAFDQLSEAASTAVQQIETGYPHCAARKLRECLNQKNGASAHDSNN